MQQGARHRALTFLPCLSMTTRVQWADSGARHRPAGHVPARGATDRQVRSMHQRLMGVLSMTVIHDGHLRVCDVCPSGGS